MMKEWKEIDGFSSYEVSNYGEVRRKNKKDGSCLKQTPNAHGRPVVKIKRDKDGKYINQYVYRLVAEAFIPNKDNLPIVNHLDNNPINCHVDNLEWTTESGNLQHASRQGRLLNRKKLSEDEVRYIKENYIPRDKEFGLMALAKKFNVTGNAIGLVVYGYTHKDI